MPMDSRHYYIMKPSQLSGAPLFIELGVLALAALLITIVVVLPGLAFAEGDGLKTSLPEANDAQASSSSASAGKELYGDEKIEVDLIADDLKDAESNALVVNLKACALGYRADMVASRVPEQQHKGEQAARRLYKMEQNRYDVIEMLLGSQSMDDFIKQVDYLQSVTQSNLDEIALATALKDEAKNSKKEIKDLKKSAAEKVEELRKQLKAAQAVRINRAKEGIATAQQQAVTLGGKNSLSKDDEKSADSQSKDGSSLQSAQARSASTNAAINAAEAAANAASAQTTESGGQSTAEESAAGSAEAGDASSADSQSDTSAGSSVSAQAYEDAGDSASGEEQGAQGDNASETQSRPGQGAEAELKAASEGNAVIETQAETGQMLGLDATADPALTSTQPAVPPKDVQESNSALPLQVQDEGPETGAAADEGDEAPVEEPAASEEAPEEPEPAAEPEQETSSQSAAEPSADDVDEPSGDAAQEGDEDSEESTSAESSWNNADESSQTSAASEESPWTDATSTTENSRSSASEGEEKSSDSAAKKDEETEKVEAKTDTRPLSDGADWSQSKEEFIAEWAPRIDNYLQGSPLYGQGENFAKSAWKYNIDPRWSAAISNTESSKGAICIRPHNAWGWGAADSDPYNLASEWGSWEEAIDAHARGLSEGYGYTITMLGAKSYCPPTWQSWYNNTLDQMAQI